MKNLFVKSVFIFSLLFFINNLSGQDCGCTECPLAFSSTSGVFTSEIEVSINGPNDLSQCNLESICIDLAHTWVGDIAIVLRSPDGTEFLIVGDNNNSTGGCGLNADNMDICIVTGTTIPLTNGGPYACNGGGICLVGNWTAGCNISLPGTGINPTPNCDLDDFNVPGSPVNGIWTLEFHDICGADSGTINDWDLSFSCPTLDCEPCLAEGGMLNQADVSGCQGDMELNLNITPTYAGTNIPPPASGYGYTFVVTQNNIISTPYTIDGPNLSQLPVGNFTICGLSFENITPVNMSSYDGQNISTLINDLALNTPFCGDVSDDCFNVQIGPPLPIIEVEEERCLGDPYVLPDGTNCFPGSVCEYIEITGTGCNQLYEYTINPILPSTSTQNAAICQGECYNIEGTDYCNANQIVIIDNYLGCDSLITLNITFESVEAVVAPPGTLGCNSSSVTLDGTGSNGDEFQWINDDTGLQVGTNSTLDVLLPGCYTLNVTNNNPSSPCTDSETVCVMNDIGNIPNTPNVSGDANACFGSNSTYSVTNDVSLSYSWTVPSDANIVFGQGTNSIEVVFSATGNFDVCLVTTNECGDSPQDCFTVNVDGEPNVPTIIGNQNICPFAVESYTINDSNPNPVIDDFTWSVPTGATINSGQGTNEIEITWGSSGGFVSLLVENECGSADLADLSVTILDLPADPDISGSTLVCPNSQVFYSTSSDINTIDFDWEVPTCATIISGQGTNEITVEFATDCVFGGDICVLPSNSCGDGNDNCITVFIDSTPTEPSVSGLNEVCNGDVETYSVSEDTDAINYVWIIGGGTIDSGQGTNEIEVTWNNGGNQQVCCNVVTDCGDSPDNCFDVLVNTTPVAPIIEGTDIVCVNDMESYELTSDVSNVDDFLWSLAGGGSISSGQGTEEIIIDWTSAGTFMVCCSITNDCGAENECFDVAVNELTIVPVLGGPDAVCVNTTETYFVTNPQDNESYSWTIPSDATLVSGAGTNMITVDWGTSSGGDICVTASSLCGDEGPTCLFVMAGGIPSLGNIGGDDTPCSNTTLTYNVGTLSSANNYSWASDCGTIVSGQGTNEIMLDIDNTCSSIILSVYAQTECGDTQASSLTINVNSVSNAVSIIDNQNNTCISTIESYCLMPVIGANSYTWVVANGNIVNGQDSDCVDVSWTTPGVNEICVTAVNDCGEAVPYCFDINVETVTATPEIISTMEVCDCQETMANVDATGTVDVIWTVPTGATIVSGQNTDELIVNWCNAQSGNIEVELVFDCGSITDDFEVSYISTPSPNAGLDNTSCSLNYTLNTSNATNGVWTYTGPGLATFTDPSVANTTVMVDLIGAYTFTWTENSATCTGSDEVEITFIDLPNIINGIQPNCNSTNTTYTITFEVNGGTAPYTTDGIAGSWNGNIFTSDEIISGGNYNFAIMNSEGCTSYNIMGSHTCNCTTDAGTMDTTPLTACTDQSVTAISNLDQIYDGDDILVYMLHSGDPVNGQIFDTNDTGVFGYVNGMDTDFNYFISVVVGNPDGSGSVDLTDGCTSISSGVAVTFYSYPQSNAGPDETTCSVLYPLQAADNGVTGAWTQILGPSISVFSDMTDPNSEVSPSTTGTYVYQWEENNNACINNDEVEITFSEGPSLLGGQSENCDLSDNTYTVSFSLQGGTMPYFIDGTQIVGNSFTSTSIGSNIMYSFAVTDANGCGPLIVNGIRNCDCQTSAGTMDQIPIIACSDATINALPQGDEVNDGDDAVQYILHDGSGTSFGFILQTSFTPQFSFANPMILGTTYYISTIVGNDLGAGIVDINDPCLSVAIGTPVEFTIPPSGSITMDQSICEGDMANIEFQLIGTAPFNVEFDGMTLTNQPNNFTQTPSPITNTNYSMTEITDAGGCVTSVNSSVMVTVNIPPVATLEPSSTICNSTDTGNPTTIDLFQLITGGDSSGDWIDSDGAGATGSFDNLNFEGVLPGTYTFTYTTGSAVAPCDNIVYEVEITVENCVCPSVETSDPGTICNTLISYDLTSLQITDESGMWSILDQPANDPPATINSDGSIDITGLLTGSYYLVFTLDNTPPVGCSNTSLQTLEIVEEVNAGTDSEPLEYCEGTVEVVQLNDLLQNADLGGTWMETSNPSSGGGAFDATLGSFDITNQTAGTYTFTYNIDAPDPCIDQLSTHTVIINANPIADAGQDQIRTCDLPSVTLGSLNSSSGVNITYNWTASSGGVLPPDQSDTSMPTVTNAGDYQLTVTNEATTCSSLSEVSVEDDINMPEPFISIGEVSCFGLQNGIIIIDSVLNGNPPYSYSIDGGSYTTNPVYANLGSDEYTIAVSDANGCTTTLSIDVTQPELLVVQLITPLEGENLIQLGDSITIELLSNQLDEIDTIIWTPEGIQDCDTCTNVVVMPNETTTYSVTIQNGECSASDDLTIFVDREVPIFVPNAFSPNNDGLNETVTIFAGNQVQLINSFIIYSRWGEKVYEFYNFPPNDPIFGWNGIHRGKLMNTGVYTWITEITLTDGTKVSVSGDVTLIK